MSKWILITALILLPLSAFADGEGECIYDQGAFKEMLQQLKMQYPNSKYLENRTAVQIAENSGEITVKYYGCEHYGTAITFISKTKESYSRKIAFGKTIELLRQFGQNRIDTRKLRAILNKRKYEEVQNGLFFVDYPGFDEFSIEISPESGHTSLHIEFYN